MANLKVKSIHYVGDNYYYDSPEFDSGLNIMIGNNGSGKTTFCDLIYYALGGEVDQFKKDGPRPHKEIINDTNNYVELIIEINNQVYGIKREIDANDISICYEAEVESDDSKVKKTEMLYKHFPVNRNKQYAPYIFSDWILNELGINPVSLFDGYYSYVFNIKDLFRLIYYDQETIPRKIYKNPTREDKVQNTEFIRKVIFELLLGENFEKYYTAINELRKAEVDKNKSKEVLDEYQTLADEIRKDCTIELNLTFSKESLSNEKEKLFSLLKHRESLKQNINNVGYEAEIEELRNKLGKKENELEAVQNRYDYNSIELYNLRDLERNLKVEINQLKKVIYTNEQLGLFSINTCPWCLKELPPAKEGFCPCGNKLEENENIVFKYNSEEYKKILKSKNKTLKTISEAIEITIEENNKLQEIKTNIRTDMKLLRNNISSYIKQYENPISFNKIDEIDEKITLVKSRINELEDYIKIEEKLNKLRDKYSSNEDIFKQKKKVKELLESKAKLDIFGKIKDFNEKFEILMKNSLPECVQAKIDDENYMPELDYGYYKEKSAYVHARLMYFYTFLYMSLKNDNIKFPRFLLVDTPDTDGIDSENLKRTIEQLQNVEIPNKDYQVILTTLEYPDIYESKIKYTLHKPDNYLLKKREITNVNEI